jgi:phage tail-like protein
MKARGRRRWVLLSTAVIAAAGISAAASLGALAQSEPVTANRFALTIDGFEIATFSELSGIFSEVEPVYASETSDRLIPKNKPPFVTLKRGLTGALDLWTWHEAVTERRMQQARRDVSLVMFNPEGVPVARYFLTKAWPSKMELSGLQAGQSEELIETLTLTAEHVQRVAP